MWPPAPCAQTKSAPPAAGADAGSKIAEVSSSPTFTRQIAGDKPTAVGFYFTLSLILARAVRAHSSSNWPPGAPLTPSPPMVAVVVDFDGGGRFSCELADADPSAVHIGDRVEMCFRKISTADGVHNYFWKARKL